MKTKKFVISITQLDARPDDWTSPKAWPEPGIYQCGGEPDVYLVGKNGIDYTWNGGQLLTQAPFDAQATITEDLFLKALAATARAERLKE